MEAVDAMDALMEKDTIDRPVINPWRQAPSREQIHYATSLCRSELSYADRVHTIETFPALDKQAMSELITGLEAVRAARMKRLRRTRRQR
jgi:hypothetical protein